jgi:hypothetical protein
MAVRIGLAVGLIAVGAITGAVLSGFGSSSQATNPNGTNSFAPSSRPPPPPPNSFPAIVTGKPAIVLLQLFGDPDTVFLIHGEHWRPRTKVTIEIPGIGVSTVMPAVDMAGTFNYAIGQNHDFFSGPIPPGQYNVVVIGTPGSGTGTARAIGQFSVNFPPPPGGIPPPPPGSIQPSG